MTIILKLSALALFLLSIGSALNGYSIKDSVLIIAGVAGMFGSLVLVTLAHFVRLLSEMRGSSPASD